MEFELPRKKGVRGNQWSRKKGARELDIRGLAPWVSNVRDEKLPDQLPETRKVNIRQTCSMGDADYQPKNLFIHLAKVQQMVFSIRITATLPTEFLDQTETSLDEELMTG